MSNKYKKAMDDQQFDRNFDANTIYLLKYIAKEKTKKMKYSRICGIAVAAVVCIVCLMAISPFLIKPQAEELPVFPTDPSISNVPEIPAYEISTVIYIQKLSGVSVSVRTTDYFYFVNHEDGGRVYKMRSDGTGKLALSKETACELQVSGDYIYFLHKRGHSEIYKISIYGGEEICLYQTNRQIENLNVYEGNIYFRELFTNIDKREFGESDIVKGFYYIYKMDLDGKNITEIINESVSIKQYNDGYGSTIGHMAIGDFVVTDGYIYYEINTSEGPVIYRMHLDGTEKTKLAAPGKIFHISDGWIYYSNYEFPGEFNKMRLDGSEMVNVSDDYISFDCIVDRGWIYYVDVNNMSFYKKQENGTLDDSFNLEVYIYKMNMDAGERILLFIDETEYNFNEISGEWYYLPLQLRGIVSDWIYFEYVTKKGELRMCKINTTNGEYVVL